MDVDEVDRVTDAWNKMCWMISEIHVRGSHVDEEHINDMLI